MAHLRLVVLIPIHDSFVVSGTLHRVNSFSYVVTILNIDSIGFCYYHLLMYRFEPRLLSIPLSNSVVTGLSTPAVKY